jgi:hypothetical protein
VSVPKRDGERVMVRMQLVLPVHGKVEDHGRVVGEGEVNDRLVLGVPVRRLPKQIEVVQDVETLVVEEAGEVAGARVEIVTAVVIPPVWVTRVEVANHQKGHSRIGSCDGQDGVGDVLHAVIAVSVILWRYVGDGEEESGVSWARWTDSAPEDGRRASMVGLERKRFESAGRREKGDGEGFMIVEGATTVAIGVRAINGDPRVRREGSTPSSACLDEGKQAWEGRREWVASTGEHRGQLVESMAESIDVQEQQVDVRGHCSAIAACVEFVGPSGPVWGAPFGEDEAVAVPVGGAPEEEEGG